MTSLTRYEYSCHPLYLIITGGLNFPPFLLGILGVTEWCQYYSNWLVGNAGLAGLHMLASVYYVYRIRRVTRPAAISDELMEEGNADSNKNESSETDSTSNLESSPRRITSRTSSSASLNNNSNSNNRNSGCFSRLVHLRTVSSNRLRHLICYDGVFTTYCILFLFWVLWISEGAQRMRQADARWEEEDFEGCLELHDRYMTTSLVCGFTYMLFVGLAALASLC